MEEGEEEEEAPLEAIIIPTNSEGSYSSQDKTPWVIERPISALLFFIAAYLNLNTNATTRGDAQVSGRPSDLLEIELAAKRHSLS